MTWETEEMSEAQSNSGYDSALIWSDDPEKAYFRSMMDERRRNGDIDDSLIGDSTMADLMEDNNTLNTMEKSSVASGGRGASGLSYMEDDTVGRIESEDGSVRRWFTKRNQELMPEPARRNSVTSPVSALSPADPVGDGKLAQQNAASNKQAQLNAAAGGEGVAVPGFIFVTSGHTSAVKTKEGEGQPKRNKNDPQVDTGRRSRCFYGRIAAILLILAVLVAIVMLAIVFKQKNKNDDDVTSSRERLVPSPTFAPNLSSLPPALTPTQFSDLNGAATLGPSSPNNATVVSTPAPIADATLSPIPQQSETLAPTLSPTLTPVSPASTPTKAPVATNGPTASPINQTKAPTASPTKAPVTAPITSPPTTAPTKTPTMSPTPRPTPRPSRAPAIVTVPTESPTAKPTESQINIVMKQLIVISPQSSGALANPTSPQYQALEWLVQDMGDGRKLQDESSTQRMQRWVLATFYFSTGGDNWTDKTNWLMSAHECDWYQIGCDNQFRITDIQPRNNNLVGPLPLELSLLSDSLWALSLNSNQLTGTIPTSLGRLSVIDRFALTKNSLSGTIPSELSGLTKAGFLAVGRNELSGSLPSELGMLRLLETFDAGKNNLVGSIPLEYGNMISLELFSVRSNKISGEVPSVLGQLSRFKTLGFDRNDLIGAMPTEFCGLGIDMKADCQEISCPCCTECCIDGGECFASTPNPTIAETPAPTVAPITNTPTLAPAEDFTPSPSASPTKKPTKRPTESPTPKPTPRPTTSPPTEEPIQATDQPTPNPTKRPTKRPTPMPTISPTKTATKNPTHAPSPKPTPKPTLSPTISQTASPTSCLAEIATLMDCYVSGQDILVAFENCNPAPDDWIGVYPSGQDPTNLGDPIAWVWACGNKVCSESTAAGELTFFETRGRGNFQVFLIRRNSGGPYSAYGIGNEFVIGTTCDGDRKLDSNHHENVLLFTTRNE